MEIATAINIFASEAKLKSSKVLDVMSDLVRMDLIKGPEDKLTPKNCAALAVRTLGAHLKKEEFEELLRAPLATAVILESDEKVILGAHEIADFRLLCEYAYTDFAEAVEIFFKIYEDGGNYDPSSPGLLSIALTEVDDGLIGGINLIFGPSGSSEGCVISLAFGAGNAAHYQGRQTIIHGRSLEGVAKRLRPGTYLGDELTIEDLENTPSEAGSGEAVIDKVH